MNIGIIGANGKSGRMVMKEAVKRGHSVTAFVRKRISFETDIRVIVKDVFDLVYEDVETFDVVISAFGTGPEESLDLHQTSLKYLTSLFVKKPNRLLIIGSAGCLFSNADHSERVLDSSLMPEIFKPLSASMSKAFFELEARKDLQWTYFSPSLIFDATGERTGTYQIGKDELLFNSEGLSYISYADAAIALFDVAEKGLYIKERFTAVSR